jgi:hypothetical protein
VIDAIANLAVAGGYLIGTYERAQRLPVGSINQEIAPDSMAMSAVDIA